MKPAIRRLSACQLFAQLRAAAMVVGPLVLGIILFATLCPLEFRPQTGAPASVERFLAFASLGGSFAFAYPSRWRLIVCLVLAGCAALEAAQNLIPGRHGLVIDFVTKGFGSLVGAAAGLMLDGVAARIDMTDS